MNKLPTHAPAHEKTNHKQFNAPKKAAVEKSARFGRCSLEIQLDTY